MKSWRQETCGSRKSRRSETYGSREFPVSIGCLIAIFIAGSAVSVRAEDTPIDFNRDIRPIFSESCFQCHGPDKNKRQADYRLDTENGALREFDGYFAILPGKPDESELVLRITSEVDEERMPPVGSGRALTPKQIDLIKRWIAQGAKWKGHWAYLKPVKPAAPDVGDSPLIRNDIDRFVLRKLQDRGMAHSPEADPVTLIRRLYFDLTGLPPEPADVAEFLSDQSPETYEKIVDKLLASPHFGERMALYWLDLVRYADTNGIHGDNHRDISLYRDYVIDAFNENRPFDQFTIEQLAGDLLPNPTPSQRVGSGYNRLLMTTREGGAQPKEYLAKYAADRVRNVSSVWMGGTMGCSECHDHKFDPYSQKDFYSMASFFADIQEVAVGAQPTVAIITEELKEELAQLDTELAALRQKFQTAPLKEDVATWEAKIREEIAARAKGWQPLKPDAIVSSGEATLTVQEDLSVLASGKNPATDTYTLTLPVSLDKMTGLRLEALPDASFGNQGLSRGNGNFVLTELEVSVVTIDATEPQPVKIKSAAADFSQNNFPVANAIDGKSNTGWAVEGQSKAGEARQAVFVFEKPVAGGPGTALTVKLHHDSQYAQHNIGRFRLAVTNVPEPGLLLDGFPAGLAELLNVSTEQRTDAQRKLLEGYIRDQAPELADLRKQIADKAVLRKSMEDNAPRTLVAMSGPPRQMRILPRGNWLDDSGEVVAPAVPEFLPGISKEERATRLDLAKWMVAPENPLTARVFVNRLWKIAFGQGIVKSLDDFGSQGALPTHPELLDWLAMDFVEHGWDVKRTLKLIVMSGAYRQSSAATEAQRQADPYNAWLGRQSRFRLDAEMIRDNALAVSGLLVDKIGGPSAKPYQPAGYWDHLNFPKRTYQNDTGENQYRRGLYTYWCRTFLHPSLLAFDASTREECAVERPRSNTPLQALVLLNDPTYVEAARVFAERILKEGGETSASKIEFAYNQILNRAPRAEETSLLTALYEKHLVQLRTEDPAPRAILKVGDRPADMTLNPTELAAWTSVARVLLNLHETITRN